MKTGKLLLFIFLIMFALLMYSSDNLNVPRIDQLNPQDYIAALKLKKILDEIASQEPDYDIKVERINMGGGRGYKRAPVHYGYKYYVKFPECLKKLSIFLKKNNISRKLPDLIGGPYWGYAELYKYIYDPKYSFYICLYLLTGQEDHWGPLVDTLLPLPEKNKRKWDSDIKHWTQSLIRFHSLDTEYQYTYPKELYLNLLPNKYRNQLKKNPKFMLDGFVSGILKKGDKFVWIYRSQKRFIPFEKVIETYKKNKSKVNFATIVPNGENLKNWLQFIFNVDKEEMLFNLEVFLTYLRSQKESKPLYPVSIMTLFIVKGYTFDPKTGNYIPNEAGKMMLDYVVENPIDDNVARLKIIMDGGNTQLIKDLMKKYSTTEKWDKYMLELKTGSPTGGK